MRLKKFVVGDLGVNCYIIIDEQSKECVAVDPGADPYKITSFIETEGLSLKAIVLTHGHYDHIGGCLEIRDRMRVPIYAGEKEAELLKNANTNLATVFGDDLVLSADKLLKTGDKLEIGELEMEIIETPGHTPGGICLYFDREGVLFSGDTLFYCSVGRTDFPTGDSDKLSESLQELAKLKDDVVVYPGHGNETTIGFEKKNNPYMGM